MLTLTEINAATGDQISRLDVRVSDAAYEDAKATNLRFTQSLDLADDHQAIQTAALERIAAALEAAAARPALNIQQALWVDLYNAHLKARKDPAVITSVTGDQVVRDIVLDAAMMTATVFDTVKAAMAALEVPPGGVDWT